MLMIWLCAQLMKSMNWNSATGRMPVSEAPKAAYNGSFGDGRVNHALATEVMNKSFGNLEGAAIHTDIFSDAEDSRIAFHLFPNAFADCFEVSDRCHYRKCATSLAAPSFFFFTCFTLGVPYSSGISTELSQKTRSPAVDPSG